METPIMTQILRKAIESPSFSKEVLPVVPMSVFNSSQEYKELVGIIKRYYQTNRNVLNEDTFLTLAQTKLDRMRKDVEEQQKYFDKIHSLYKVRDNADDSIIDENIEIHIKKAMQIDWMTKVAMNLENPSYMDKAAEEFKQILLLNLTGKRDEIINVLDDAEYKRTSLSTLYQNMIPTGFVDIDHLNGGGLAKGELGMVVAASGTGKTLILTNLATNYTKMKKNVLFIALEELENRMILKLEQSLLRRNRSQILTGSQLNQVEFDKNQQFIKEKRHMFGNLFFARFSPRTITPAKVEQLISDVKLRWGIDLDVVIIDYPELLRDPNATGDDAKDGGRLFEEMRRIGQEYNVVMWTAAQMNRSAYSATIRTSENMEGSLRKKNAAELILTVQQSDEEFRAGFVRLYADKLRNPPEGQFDKMLGLKVVGSAQTVRNYKSEQERKEHLSILESIDDARDAMFKNKRKGKQDNTQMPNYADEINQSIQRTRGAS
ncbi:DNA helicase [Bacillus phage vB_BanH_Emiliahah]|nr:DNA helicase [Bacillus phage vB_BanH_Emiliahah]